MRGAKVRAIICAGSLLVASLASSLLHAAEQSQPAASGKPNLLVIMADDLGWSDIGAFGGEISTPNIDQLAQRGVQFTNFYASPYCSPSRSMLLTGSDNHAVGLGTMSEFLGPETKGQPGYEGHLNTRAVTIAQRLRQAGYYTMMSGKWHLGHGDDQSPASWGFDRSFALLNGEANHYKKTTTKPSPDGTTTYRLDGKVVDIPDDFYSSDYYANQLISFIDTQPAKTPFFAYLAFTAPHSPLQAPQSLIKRYEGVYDAGPQALANSRLAKMKAMGLVDADTQPHPLTSAVSWSALSAEQRKLSTRRMETYAAMIEGMDTSIGRVLEKLDQRGELKNTVVVFLSDNGAAGSSREANPKWGPWISAYMDNSLANIGNANSYVSTGPEWAQASMTPSAYFKGFPTEGGTHSPAIIAGPSIAKGAVAGSYAHITDLVPTLLGMAGAPAVDEPGKAHLEGASLVSVLQGPKPEKVGPAQPKAMEMRGGKAVKQGDLKAVYLPTFPSGLPAKDLPLYQWQLFNLAKDPGETTDIAAAHPEQLRALEQHWQQYANRVGVVQMPDFKPAAAQ
ncbi:arylsulfatase [Pseudomonas yamanorum]|nr:arylsulfatase [Pseudomonas yamanorum]